MKSKNTNWKLMLIIIGIVMAVILCGVFMVNSVPNKAISLEEQITTAQSEIKVQEKRRADLIPNLVDCVKAYDKHEYQTLMDVVNARKGSSDEVAEQVKMKLDAIAEAYPDLKSQKNYQELMNELATTENKIARTRSNYNLCITRYNTYCKKFPHPFILSITGYEKQNFDKLNYNVSDDAPTNLFD